MKTKFLILLVLLITPFTAMAQFDFGEDIGTPWSQFNLNQKTRVKLEFRNANPDFVLQFFSKQSGVTIIKDPTLTAPLTITSAGAVSLDQAFEILNAVLGLHKFEIVKQGSLLVVKPASRSGRGGDSGESNPFGSFDPSQFSSLMDAGRTELRVYPLLYANASQVARVINEVFQSTQNPFEQFFQQFQGGNNNNNNSNSNRGSNNNSRDRGAELVPAQEDGDIVAAGAQFGGRRGRRGGGFNFGNLFGGNRNSNQTVRASYDEFSNSVIVNAPAQNQKEVEELISQIDRPIDQALKPRVFVLDYAAAEELAPVINDVLESNVPLGRGGQTAQTNQGFFGFGRGRGNNNRTSSSGSGSVVADPRTNSLIVSATEENLNIVAEVIRELDKEVEYESTTFVLPLANAQSGEMADLLNQAFGGGSGANRQTTNRNTRTNTNTNTNNRNNNQNRQNRNNFNNSIGQGDMELALDDPNEDYSNFQTSVAVQQGRGLGQQNQGNQNRLSQGQDGRLINVRDLAGQVTIISDPNTNSLIIVTLPEYADLVKSVVGQLDRIPEQVMIETIIVEATLDSSTRLGIEWSLAQNKVFGDPAKSGVGETQFGLENATPALEGFRYTLTGGDLSGFLNALKTDTRFEILSTPRIFTSNNREAEINISQQIPYILSTREDANGNLTFNYAFQDVGIILTVTPRISANGTVTMDINQTANDLQGFTDFNAPIVNQRQAFTTVSVNDGETIILGGIIRSTVSSTVKKIPLLGDIPILGNLFKSTNKSNVKTELLVFLTPRIVRNSEEAKKLREDQQQEMSPNTQKKLEEKIGKPESENTDEGMKE